MNTIHALILIAQIAGTPFDIFLDKVYSTAEYCDQERVRLTPILTRKNSKNVLVCRVIEVRKD